GDRSSGADLPLQGADLGRSPPHGRHVSRRTGYLTAFAESEAMPRLPPLALNETPAKARVMKEGAAFQPPFLILTCSSNVIPAAAKRRAGTQGRHALAIAAPGFRL